MKKFLIWLGGSVLGMVVLLAGIGAYFDGEKDSPDPAAKSSHSTASGTESRTASTAAKNMAANYPPDQCLDGVCVGIKAGDLQSANWLKKEAISTEGMTAQQSAALAKDFDFFVKECVAVQSAWGRKATSMCETLGRSAEDSYAARFHALPTSKVLAVFEDQKLPVNQFYDGKRPLRLKAFLGSPTGQVYVEFRLDINGMLRVFSIEKHFIDQGATANNTIAAKLFEKHPYMTQQDFMHNPPYRKHLRGTPTWQGEVKFMQRDDQPPSITMYANAKEFEVIEPASAQPKNLNVK